MPRRPISALFVIALPFAFLMSCSGQKQSLANNEYATQSGDLGVKMVSDNELEYNDGQARVLSTYSQDRQRLRAVCDIYFQVLSEGLQHEDGRVLVRGKAGPEQGKIRLTQAAIGRNGPIAKGLTMYKWDIGKFPNTVEGLASLYKPSDFSKEEARYTGPYLAGTFDELRDPWGFPFEYRSRGKMNNGEYDLWSRGPDKRDDEG